MAKEIAGVRWSHPIDAVLVNSPIKDYGESAKLHSYTLPVLGLGYLATYAAAAGLNVGVLDAEALGLAPAEVGDLINEARPRWVGLNLLAPSYELSVRILNAINQDIRVVLGGHQAKAMPAEITGDRRLQRVDALIIGEGETRLKSLLEGDVGVEDLPGLWYRNERGEACQSRQPNGASDQFWTAPDLDLMPFLDRSFLIQDPYLNERGLVECALVGSRGCPYDCSFCGAARSANPDVLVRTRLPSSILEEMFYLQEVESARAFRFVDDLFLASPGFIRKCMTEFIAMGVGEAMIWDATGRINTLSRVEPGLLDKMKQAGCHEVALGIESGSDRVLGYIGKQTTSAMSLSAVERLLKRGISVKGYIILGFPTETREEMQATIEHVRRLWSLSDRYPGRFRCSAFEFRPYPGTPEWSRLIASGKFSVRELSDYHHVELVTTRDPSVMSERDEFNFSVNRQFGEVPVQEVRESVRLLAAEQADRSPQ